MGAQGTTTVDFGAFPGKSDASATVTGQAAIVAGSLVEAWIRPVDTADHSADEHMVETLKVFAHSIIAGTGFSISMFNTSEVHEPIVNSGGHVNPNQQTLGTMSRSEGGRDPLNGIGGIGTRIYGLWTVAWAWN